MRATRPTERPGAVEYADAVVVGSGFGGSAAAYRLAEGGRSVVVLERGKAYPPGSFARNPAEWSENFWSPKDGLFGLVETWSFTGLEGVVSSGLGGGSLVYANVLLRKDPEWFVTDSPIPGGGYETWPITREDLDPHYDRVERMLGATRYPYRNTPRTQAFEQAAHEAGFSTLRPPIAVTFGRPGEAPAPLKPLPTAPYGNIHGATRLSCSLCGECDIGCNYGAKNSLDHTYLSAAAHHGADVRPLHEMVGFRRLDDGFWEVRYVVHDPDEPERSRVPQPRVIRCANLVLATGTFSTVRLLLRNWASLPDISRTLGSRFSGNGDLLGFMIGAKEKVDRIARTRSISASKGPTITSMVRVGDAQDGAGDTGRGYYVEDAGYPGFLNWLIETGQLRSVVSRTTRVAATVLFNRMRPTARTSLSRDLAAAMGRGSVSNSSMLLLGMGRDVPDGKMYLEHGRLQIDWNISTSRRFFEDMRRTMRKISDSLGARYADNPLWWLKRTITVHPLGGAPMGRDEHEGVVDEFGEVFGYPGLYILDGSIVPGPVGPNPALTIAAIADRGAEHILETEPHRMTRPAETVEPAADTADAAPRTSFDGATAVSFTEQMKGYFTLGVGDPQEAYDDARVRDEAMMFELTITADDVDAFVSGTTREARAEGYLMSDTLGGKLTVQRGWFNLFVRPEDADDRRMRYRLWLTNRGGAPLTFVGYKHIHDDPGPDLWSDTTTLYVQVLEGHLGQGDDEEIVSETGLLPADDDRVLGAGVLRIKARDFAKQLTTFRADGPDGVTAIAKFGSLFLGELWSVYRGLITATAQDEED